MKNFVKLLPQSSIFLLYVPRSDTCSTCDKYKMNQAKYPQDLIEYANDENRLKEVKKNVYRLELNIKLRKLLQWILRRIYQYRRQLSLNIYVHETVEKRDADAVVFIWHHFINDNRTEII